MADAGPEEERSTGHPRQNQHCPIRNDQAKRSSCDYFVTARSVTRGIAKLFPNDQEGNCDDARLTLITNLRR